MSKSNERVKCPCCKEKIRRRVKVCPYCRSRLVWKGRWLLNISFAIICAVMGLAFPFAFIGTLAFLLTPILAPKPKEK